MCLAIYKPAGAWAAKAALHTAFKNNPSGAGYAWHDGTKVQLKKGFFTWRSFWKSYKQHVTAEVPAFIHFRIVTRGGKTAANCHPFQLSNGVLMHNGPLLNATCCAGDEVRSDSRQFAEDFIDGLSSAQVVRLRPMIEDFIGTEKVLMLFDDGVVVIAGERQGHWANGCWWSNSSYEDYRPSMTSFMGGEGFDEEEAAYYRMQYGTYSPRTQVSVVADRIISGPPATLVWSPKLLRPVRKDVLWCGVEYEWNEEHHAYVRGTLGPFAEADEDVVYDQAEDDATQLEEVGFVVADSEDYDDLIAVADATQSSVVATATQE